MSNLAPYQAVRERNLTNKYKYAEDRQILKDKKITCIYNDAYSSRRDSYTASTDASAYMSSGYVSDITSDERLFNVDTNQNSNRVRPPTLQEQIFMPMEYRDESRQDHCVSTSVLPLMKYPVALNTRQAEMKALEDNHKNINKKLNERAQKAVTLAQRSKLVIGHFILMKKTESTRLKETGAPVRYLETVDGIDCAAEIKIEQKAKERAIALLHDEAYRFNWKAGLAAYCRSEMTSKHRTASTRLGPIV